MLEKSKGPMYFAMFAMMVVTLWALAWTRAREDQVYHTSLPALTVETARRLASSSQPTSHAWDADQDFDGATPAAGEARRSGAVSSAQP
jgi:hypothetical protein